MHRYKIQARDQKAQEKTIEGVNEIVDTVKITLGPCGRNVLTDKKGASRITNDGVSIASDIVLKDELANTAAQAIVEAGIKQRDMVGDGTTTAMLLTGAIVKEATSKIGISGFGENPMSLKKQISKSCEVVVEELKKMSVPVKTKEELERVASLALEDEKLGKMVADIVGKVGKDGFVSVDDTYGYEITNEVVQGMKFYGTYAYKLPKEFADMKKKAMFEDSPILVVDGQFESLEALTYVLNVVQNTLKKKCVVIIAESFSKEVLNLMTRVAVDYKFPILPIKTPSLTDEAREDISLFTGAKFFTQQTPETQIFEKATRHEDYGWADKVIVDMEDVIIVGGKGDKKAIENRIKELKEHVKIEKTLEFKKRIERRIASIAGKVGIIKVGANTDAEKYYLMKKLENAVNSSKAAMEEGIVPGGGLALKKIAEKLPKDILTEVLKAPYKQIQENAGGNLKIGKDIIDPVKVTRIALQNACSLAGMLITTGAIVVWKQLTLEKVVKDIMDDKGLIGIEDQIQ